MIDFTDYNSLLKQVKGHEETQQMSIACCNIKNLSSIDPEIVPKMNEHIIGTNICTFGNKKKGNNKSYITTP